jgi:uncharacterized protein (DUF58 family)
VLTLRGIVVALAVTGLLTAGLAAGVEEFVLMGLALGVLEVVVVTWVLWASRRARRQLRVRTTIGRVDLRVGEDAEGRVVVTNTAADQVGPLLVESPEGRWHLSRPGLSPAGRIPAPEERDERRPWRSDGSPRTVSTMGAGGMWSMALPIPTEARGLLTLRPLRVWVSDPFGLAARVVGEGAGVHVVVCPIPAETPLAPFVPTEVGQRNSAPIEGPARAWRPAGDELADLRDYRQGDRMSRLHWPALARTGELVVRDFVEPLGARVPLLIDLQPDREDPDGSERAIGAAARVGLDILAAGYDVEVRTTAGEWAVVSSSSDGAARLLRVLALLRADPRRGLPSAWARDRVLVVSGRGVTV